MHDLEADLRRSPVGSYIVVGNDRLRATNWSHINAPLNAERRLVGRCLL